MCRLYLIQPHFDYYNLVWGNCGKTSSDRLQKLQNDAARVLTFSSYDADANRLLNQLGWKDLHTQRQILKALMVYKSLNGFVSSRLFFFFFFRLLFSVFFLFVCLFFCLGTYISKRNFITYTFHYPESSILGISKIWSTRPFFLLRIPANKIKKISES